MIFSKRASTLATLGPQAPTYNGKDHQDSHHLYAINKQPS